MFNDYFFWFAQPSSILNSYDQVMGWVFAGLLVLGVIAWMVKRYAIQHPVTQKLVSYWLTALIWIGIIGLVWFGFRYEAVPIFSKRIWSAGVIIFGLIWLGWVKWYLIRHFPVEKREYDYNNVKSKYIPGRR